MLKRFYSKKSGFTLVEIVVAFAVFAIMASMIAQMLNIAILQRNSNNLYAQELAKQERLLTVIEKDQKYYNATDKTGAISMNFDNGTKFGIDYQVKATDPAAENQAEGINYFISPVDYGFDEAAGSPVSGGSSITTVGASQESQLDTRLAGSTGLGNVTVHHAEYAGEYNGGYVYYFQVSASCVDDSGKITFKQEDVAFGQYRMYFLCDELDAKSSAVEYSSADGKKIYTYDIYQKANIIECGYIFENDFSKISGKTLGQLSTSTNPEMYNDTNNQYRIQQMGTNSIRISTPYEFFGTTQGKRFSGSKYSTFYVIFDKDPHITTASFGYNGVSNGSGGTVYTAFPNYKSEYDASGNPTYVKSTGVHSAIYGAYIYSKHEKSSS